MQKYHHLTASKRGEIQALKAAGATLKQIADLKEYQYKINSRPRSKLNFQSPKFVFYKEINKFALVT